MQYFIHKSFDDILYRFNEAKNELELYCGNGIWEAKEGMYLDYRTGYGLVCSISDEDARKIIKIVDNQQKDYRFKMLRKLMMFAQIFNFFMKQYYHPVGNGNAE